MSNSIYTPYTYLIGWSKMNRWYYGVRYSKSIIGRLPEEDLWIHYFTSSRLVSNYRLTFGEPDVIQVRRTFSCAEAAIRWEQKILQRMKVVKKDNWLNESSNLRTNIHAGEKNKGRMNIVKNGRLVRIYTADFNPDVHQAQHKNRVMAKNASGEIVCVSKEEFKTSDLVGQTKGKPLHMIC